MAVRRHPEPATRRGSRRKTHDSELSAAVLDTERDPRAPTDPGGVGDGARRFARQLRLGPDARAPRHVRARWQGEHLDRVDEPDDSDLTAPDRAAELVRRSAAGLDAWYASGCLGPRPPGRLRRHTANASRPWRRWLTDPAYRALLDPDGRPLGMKLRRTF